MRRSENGLQLGRGTVLRLGDPELTEQVAKMNSAPEDKKTDLMAAILTHMVEQRITMDARKAQMEEETMKHMMHVCLDRSSDTAEPSVSLAGPPK
jgi:uncharacterized protein involved in copper resistance